MSNGRPRPQDYTDLQEFAQAAKAWNERNNVTSDDIVKQWNEERRNAR
jgi:hypothetical protein